ncbi:MAG: hypothetical protein ACOCVG_00775 [Verrucomicrobiota bacterium]
MKEDESHLDSLAVAHYAVGTIMVLLACMPLLHVFFGLAIISGWDVFGDSNFVVTENGEQVTLPDAQAPAFFGWIFAAMGLAFFLVGQAIAISIIVSGRYLKKRKNHLFSFVLACLACFFVPIGTLLGVFTIIVLSRDSVKQLYEERKAPQNSYGYPSV